MDQPYVKKGFLTRHGIDAFVVSLFTVTIIVLALIPGIGYDAITQAQQRGIIGATHHTGSGYALNRLFNGTISADFSPLLYPISYLSGCSHVLRKFTGASESWDYEGKQLQEAAVLGTLFVEFAKNVPFFLALGVLSSMLVARLSRVPKITELFDAHLPGFAKADFPRSPEDTVLPKERIERTRAKRGLIRRIIAIQLIVSAYALAYVGIVYWNMFWPIFFLVILLVIVGAILF